MTLDFWAGRRVLVTGDTGFKGAWLALWLERLGAQVSGLSLDPVDGGAYSCFAPWGQLETSLVDIRDVAAVHSVVSESAPEIVFHLAAQALVVRAWEQPRESYETNVMGTVNLLESVRDHDSTRCVIVVTTDKVYAPVPGQRAHREGDRLGSTDPYGSSKVCVEMLTRTWSRMIDSSRTRLCTARSGNVIGGGDWSRDRLVPDAIRSLRKGSPVRLRHPSAIRPWQHVLEPLYGYLLLAESAVTEPSIAPASVNLGPAPTQFLRVSELVELVIQQWGGGEWVAGEGSYPEEDELLLDSSLAQDSLGWKPKLEIEEAVRLTIEWYRASATGSSMRDLSLRQIDAFMESA